MFSFRDMAKRNLDNIEIVVGIDFGTSYSTYAYSYAYDQNKIFMNSDWPSGSKACKEMTAILFNGDLMENLLHLEKMPLRNLIIRQMKRKNLGYFLTNLKWPYTMKRLVI